MSAQLNSVVGRLMGVTLRALMWLAARLSRGASLRVAALMGKLALRTESGAITRINLSTCYPTLSEVQLEERVRSSLLNMCLMFFELSQVRYWTYERLLEDVTLSGEDVLAEAAKSNNGVLLVVPHLGNWEIMTAYLGENFRLAALYDPPKFAGLEPVIVETRERYSGEMFPIGVGGLRSVMKWLRSGGLVAVLPDQVPDRNAGVYADFFGQPALTMTLVHELAQRTRPELVMGWVRRTFDDSRGVGSYGYELNFAPLELSLDERDQVITATQINKAIEAAIAHAPEQYQWEYKRFKRPPTMGQANIYRRQ